MSKLEFLVGPPPAYTSLVEIQRTARGTYRCDGGSNSGAGEPGRFASPHFYDIENAKLVAAEGARKARSYSYFPAARVIGSAADVVRITRV